MATITKMKADVGSATAQKTRNENLGDVRADIAEPVKKLEERASQLSEQLFNLLGYEKLSAYVSERVAETLLAGTRVTGVGMLDFSAAEERFLKLPEQWLKLVEKFLKQLIDDLEKLGAGASRTKLVSVQKAVITMSSQAKEMLRNAGMGELVSRGVITDVEGVLVAKNGERKPVSLTASALSDEAGNIQGVVIAAKDLGEIQRLQKEKMDILKNAKEKAEIEIKARTAELEKSKKDLEKSLATEKAITQQLKAADQQQKAANQQLAVAQKNLQDKLLELERFNKVAVGRELKMVELKEEIARLKASTQK